MTFQTAVRGNNTMVYLWNSIVHSPRITYYEIFLIVKLGCLLKMSHSSWNLRNGRVLYFWSYSMVLKFLVCLFDCVLFTELVDLILARDFIFSSRRLGRKGVLWSKRAFSLEIKLFLEMCLLSEAVLETLCKDSRLVWTVKWTPSKFLKCVCLFSDLSLLDMLESIGKNLVITLSYEFQEKVFVIRIYLKWL